MILSSIGLAGTVATLPGTLELGALTLGSLLRGEGVLSNPSGCGKLAVVVPAHDEASGIAACVASLFACAAPPNGLRVVVIADNCTDDTAALAREAGAEVIERHDLERRGKGYALEVAFDQVLEDADVEAVLVVDADTGVEHNFLVEMAGAFGAGADGAQCRYLIGNADATDKGHLMNVALLAFNVARPRGRAQLGLSVGILGNGFGLHRRVLERLPYTARSVVEDLEYHLMMVREGFTMRFVESTSVTADLPVSEEGQTTQRARWEGGRYRMIREHAPGLLLEVLTGRGKLLEPLGELLLLPLATHVGILTVVLVVPFPPTQLYAASALALVAAHVAASIYVGGGGRAELMAIAKAPMYVLQKAKLLPSILRASKATQAWVRTARD